MYEEKHCSNLFSKEGSPRNKVVRRVISPEFQLRSFARTVDLEWRSSDAAYMSFVSEFHRAVACTLLNSERFIPHRSHFSNKNTWLELIKRANEGETIKNRTYLALFKLAYRSPQSFRVAFIVLLDEKTKMEEKYTCIVIRYNIETIIVWF